MEIDEWLTPVSSESSCGPDLEYDDEYMYLEQASRGKEEQQYGDTLIPAEDPDWRDIEKAGTRLLKRSKDLRVAGLLARAWTRVHGVKGFSAGLALNRLLLEHFWPDVHPRLEVEEEYDPVPRSNALAILVAPDGLPKDVRSMALLQMPGLIVTVREAEAILTTSTQTDVEQAISRAQLISMLLSAYEDGNGEIIDLLQAYETLKVIRQITLDRLGHEYSPDFSSVINLLEYVLNPIRSRQQAESSSGLSPDQVNETLMSEHPGGHGVLAPIRSRDDVRKVLTLACEYLERNEPTNPAPLLIRRAQKMMAMDFLSIIQELAPDSLNQVHVVTGSPNGFE